MPPLLLVILGFWLVAPVLLVGRLAQDAVPFVAAGRLARDDPSQVYTQSGDLFILPEVFARVSCDASPAGTDCENENVAFVSPPPGIPVAVLVSLLGPTAGPLAMRFAVSACLVAGFLALRRRLVLRDRAVDPTLVALALVLTPTFMVPQSLGQTSPLLFLSAALGIAVAGRSRAAAVGVGVLWAFAVALKLTPVLLLVVLVVRRRWTTLAVGLGTLAALTVAALPFGGLDAWRWFLDSAGELQANAPVNPYNGSLEAFVHVLAPATTGTSTFDVTVWGIRLAAAAVMAWTALRIRDEDAQWSFAWLGSFMLVPLVWWHYLWVAFAAIAIAMSVTTVRSKLASPVGLVVLAAVGLPLSFVNGTGSSVPWAQFVFLVAALAWSGWLAVGREEHAIGVDVAAPAAGRGGTPDDH